ncbi:MAG: methyltransferase domain-containing protein [Anaerolineales bacterium]|nr:methyltransferase domain-containing protein [Anaerolineales bacterium]
MTYEEHLPDLRESYNRAAAERDQRPREAWKVEIREDFLRLLQSEGKSSLLEIGAGTGMDSKFFADNGLDVICTDLSPEHVRYCQDKGLQAYVMDFMNLDFPPSSFDAVYAMSCLLHVTKKDFPMVLNEIWEMLRPSGLFFLGQYGGKEFEGIYPEDRLRPKRFFSFFTDEDLKLVVSDTFDILMFNTLPLEEEEEYHFQHLILRRPAS